MRPPPSPAAAERPFALRSFTPPPASLAVKGGVSRGLDDHGGEQLTIRYQLEDPEGLVQVPPPAALPRRRDQLWMATCFECFLAPAGAEAYWEVNLSPSGDWNLYRLSGYRRGLAPEAAIAGLPFRLARSSRGLELQLGLVLAPLVAAGQPLDLAITAVLALVDGGTLFWALVHPGTEADFHRRDGFVLRI